MKRRSSQSSINSSETVKRSKNKTKKEEKLRYKACRNSIVTLLLLKDSITNENRNGVVDSKYAKFRTNKVKVVEIYNPETGEYLDEDVSIYDNNFIYQKNKIVTEDMSNDFDIVCTYGIHYYKTYDAALSHFYQAFGHKVPDGPLTVYKPDGRKFYRYHYKNSVFHGKYIQWDENENVVREGNFKNGLEEGEFLYWKNNILNRTMTYSNGMLEGRCNKYNKNGDKKYTCYWKNGTVYREIEYDNGIITRVKEFGPRGLISVVRY